jgi:very-short-patch-repair endonuclease
MPEKRRRRNLASRVKPWKKRLARKYARNQTRPEAALWDKLKGKQLGFWFYKQKVILGYIADFWCPAASLVVEVDGPFHRRRVAYDRRRDAAMAREGILTLRFPVSMVMARPAAVAGAVRAMARRRAK